MCAVERAVEASIHAEHANVRAVPKYPARDISEQCLLMVLASQSDDMP